MLLVLPKQDDVRKYGFFFDSGQEITLKTISDVRDLIRNSRASVASQSGDTLVSHPVMGLALYSGQVRAYYSKLTIMAEAPDFSSDAGVVRTLLVTGLKDGSGRKQTQMSLNDNFASNTPFPGNTSTFWATPFALIPTKIGTVNMPQTYTISFPDTVVTVTSQSRQTTDSYRHIRRVYTAAGSQDVTTTPHSWLYTFTGANYSNWPSDVAGAMAFSLGAYVESVSNGGYWRASSITRRNLYDSGKNVPCSKEFGSSALAESSVTIDKFAIFIYEGTRIRTVVYGPDDFNTRNVAVGNSNSITIPEMPKLYLTEPIVL